MKNLIMILALAITAPSMAQDGVATTTKKTFSRSTVVQINITANADIVWTLLTSAPDYTRWNSTVTSLVGDIEKGKKIKLKTTLDEKRTFKLKIKELDNSGHTMIWGDGKGNRVFDVKDNGDGTVTFSMDEKIGGLMFPMYAKFIPSFDEAFETFASDLKAEAELIQNTKN